MRPSWPSTSTAAAIPSSSVRPAFLSPRRKSRPSCSSVSSTIEERRGAIIVLALEDVASRYLEVLRP